jgi:putative colanic acid biosynthesis acetyltransferase WcaF
MTQPSSDKIQDLSVFHVPPGFRGRNAFVVQLWWIVNALLFATSPQFMYEWRVFLLKLFGARIGRGVKIRPGVKVTYPWNLTMGDHCWVGDGSKIYNLAKIQFGDNVALADDVHLISGSHEFLSTAFEIYAKPISIESQSWLCASAFVHQGVTIGEGSVIGAGAIVTHDTEPFSINVGAPARAVGDRRLRRSRL